MMIHLQSELATSRYPLRALGQFAPWSSPKYLVYAPTIVGEAQVSAEKLLVHASTSPYLLFEVRMVAKFTWSLSPEL